MTDTQLTNNPYSPSGYSFSRQREGEKVVMLVRKHWYILAVRIAWSTLAMIAVIIALVAAYQLSSATTQNVVVITLYVIFTILWLVYMVYEYHDWWEDKLIITNQRILSVDRVGLFSRTVVELELAEVQDSNYLIQGMIGTMFKFGTITVQSASDNMDIRMDHIDNPKRVQEEITQLARRAKHSQD